MTFTSDTTVQGPVEAPTVTTPPGPVAGHLSWVAVAVAVIGLVVHYQSAWGLLAAAATAVPLERVIRRHDQPTVRPARRTDIVHFLFTYLLQTAGILLATRTAGCHCGTWSSAPTSCPRDADPSATATTNPCPTVGSPNSPTRSGRAPADVRHRHHNGADANPSTTSRINR